jgi:hypothetical protein
MTAISLPDRAPRGVELAPSHARFDWYAATIDDEVSAVLDGLVDALGAEPEFADRSMNGYESQVLLRAGGSTVARLLYGGNGGRPHVFASSDHTDAFVSAVRGMWPDRHRVTRCDVAQDFDQGPGTWDRIAGMAEDFAAGYSMPVTGKALTTSVAGDWLTEGSPAGRTLYLGSMKSAVFLRIYEKGKQLRGAALESGRVMDAAGISEDLVRVELVVKPEKDARYLAASMGPLDGFGFAVWAKDFAAALLGLDVERVHIKEVRKSDDERALSYMLRQYGAVLERIVRDQHKGSWTGLGLGLRDRLAETVTGRE